MDEVPNFEDLLHDLPAGSDSSDAFFEPFERATSRCLLRLKHVAVDKLTEEQIEENHQAIHRAEAFDFELKSTKLQFQRGLINRSKAIALIAAAVLSWGPLEEIETNGARNHH